MDEYKSFTIKSDCILDEVVSEVSVQTADIGSSDMRKDSWKAIWDTGATSSCISQKVVDELGLISEGYQDIYTASGPSLVQTFYINIWLTDDIVVDNLLVPCVDLGENAEVLIGMDVICRGDMALTNYKGETVFSFRIPSKKVIDFEID